MRITYYWRLLRGKTSALNPAKLDVKHVWAVFQCWIRSLFPVRKHIKEQIVWRRYQVSMKSPECLKQGNCIQCGCEMNGKLKADMGCENEPFCYPEMMKRREWIKFKNQLKCR